MYGGLKTVLPMRIEQCVSVYGCSSFLFVKSDRNADGVSWEVYSFPSCLLLKLYPKSTVACAGFTNFEFSPGRKQIAKSMVTRACLQSLSNFLISNKYAQVFRFRLDSVRCSWSKFRSFRLVRFYIVHTGTSEKQLFWSRSSFRT